MELFSTMYTTAAQMITDHHQVPINGVGSTGAFQFINYVMTTCNRNRPRYASKYRRNEQETPVISTSYSNFLSFIGILKLYGVPMCPPVYPSKEDMEAGQHTWRIPPLVQQVIRKVPALASKLSEAMRYIYTGVPLRRVQKIGDLLTDDMRQAMRKLDDTGAHLALPNLDGADTTVDPNVVRCALYAKHLTSELGRQTIDLTQRKQALDLKLVTATQTIAQYQDAIRQAEAAFQQRLDQMRTTHDAMVKTLQTRVGDLTQQQDQLKTVDAVLSAQLARISSCQTDIGRSFERGLDLGALETIARAYNSATLYLPTKCPGSAGGGAKASQPSNNVTVPKDTYDALVKIAAELKKHAT
jgi:hypothetical protein